MKFKLKAYSIWEFGQRKDSHGNPHQEDSLYPAFGKQADSDRLFVLCDGMGGHAAGEVASAEVCNAISRYINANCPNPEGDCPMFVLIDAVNAAFDALDACNSLATRSMGTTMTMLKLHSHGATIAHIGDSRVYHIRPGKTAADTVILHKTQDHSLVNDLLRNGKITPEEARTFPNKNIITRAMQPGLEERPEAEFYRTTDIRPGDYFYLCSDGMLEQDDMNYGFGLQRVFSHEMSSDADRVTFLRGATIDNRDNHTAFIIHIHEVIHDGAEQRDEVPQVEPADDDSEPELVAIAPDDNQPDAIVFNPAVADITDVTDITSRPLPPPIPDDQASTVEQRPASPKPQQEPSQARRPDTPPPFTTVVDAAPRQAPSAPRQDASAPRPVGSAPRQAHPAPNSQPPCATVPATESSEATSLFDKFADFLDDVFRGFGIKDRRLGALIFSLIVVTLIILIIFFACS